MQSAGQLHEDTVVATVMSNLGFLHAMRDAGIEVVTTAVGDRYVLEALRAGGLNLGGEQSGHVVFTDAATTGDGLLTALHVMARMAETGAAAGRARRGGAPAAAGAGQRRGARQGERGALRWRSPKRCVAAEAELGDDGRVLLRPSGTEQLVRVMVEAATPAARRRDRASRRRRRRSPPDRVSRRSARAKCTHAVDVDRASEPAAFHEHLAGAPSSRARP